MNRLRKTSYWMERFGVSRHTAIDMMRRGDIPGAFQSVGGLWYAPEDPPADGPKKGAKE